MITLYTIGFTKKNAEKFFTLLADAKVTKLVDIRINNTSQLAGFAKGSDLAYFTKVICNIGYEHIIDFAPTKELLSDYQNKNIDWAKYEIIFNSLLEQRNVLSKYSIDDLDGACFLCTEDTPEHCHRRLLAEYFRNNHPDKDIRIVHLM